MSDEPQRGQGWGLILAALLGALFGGFICLLVGLWFGAWAIDTTLRHSRYVEERDALDAIVPPIAKDPAFKDVHITEESSGMAWISGYVPTTADKKRLKDLIIRALGERHGEYLMKPVRVRDEQR
jgi:hypothetical protein